MRSPGPAIGLGAQWTQGNLRNQDRWDEFVEAQCPGAGLIKWGLHKREMVAGYEYSGVLEAGQHYCWH